jgi:hypothetical protein
MTRERPKCEYVYDDGHVCDEGIHVAMFGRQWVHWSHLLDLDHKAVPPEPSQREAQDGSSGAGESAGQSGRESASGSLPGGANRDSLRGLPSPLPERSLPLTARQFDAIEAGYESIYRRYQ